MLILPIKKKWFEMILSGEKTEEYREVKPYWTTRFEKLFEFAPYDGYPTGSDIHEVIFRNGYGSNAPYVQAECSLYIGTGKTEWGAEIDAVYYVLKIHRIINCNRKE